MRILHIDSERGFGGGQRQLFFLMRGLKGDGGISQALAARPGAAIAKLARELGVTVLDLKQLNDLDFLSALALRKICRDIKPDIVHTHTSRALAIARLARKYLGLDQPPIFVNTRRVAFPLDNCAARKKLIDGADCHIAISSACKDQILQAGVRPEKVVVIPSGVEIPVNVRRDDDLKELIELTGFGEDAVIVGSGGNLSPGKRFDWLVKAFASVREKSPDARLVIFGEGPSRREIEDAITKCGQREAVFMAGYVERPERYFAGLDVFALPSRFEGLGTMLVDAMARGVPLLCADSSGVTDVVEHNVNGLMFQADSQEDLAAKLGLLVSDAELRGRLDAGPEKAKNTFDVKNTVEKIRKLYESLKANN